MGAKSALLVPFLLTMFVLVAVHEVNAADKSIVITSVEDGGTISIFPDSFPVVRPIKGKINGFSKEEITALGLMVDVSILDISQGPVSVSKKGKWVVQATLNDADLMIKASVKDKDGNELATTTIKAVASREF